MADKLYANMDATEKAKSGYKASKFLIFKETVEGETPATIAKAYAIDVLTEEYNRNQRTETNIILSNGGQPSKTDTGGEDPSGSVEVKCTPGWDVLLNQFVIGEYTTKTTFSDAHATGTAYDVGDIAILNAADTLVCTIAGTSDADDTALLAWATTAKTGNTYTDGTAVWIITKGKTAMYKYEGVLQASISTVGIILQDTVTSGVDTLIHETLGRGVSISNMSIGKEQGTIVQKTSHTLTGHGALSSTQDGYTTPTITAIETIDDTPYKRDDVCITVDGVAPEKTLSAMLNIDRQITVDDAVKCMTVAGVKTSAKITTVGTPTISGNMVARFTPEKFKQAFENVEQQLVFTYSRATGEYSKYTLPKVQLLDSPIRRDAARPNEIDINLNAYGTNAVNSMAYELLSFTDYTK
jgi:hypothetical protein